MSGEYAVRYSYVDPDTGKATEGTVGAFESIGAAELIKDTAGAMLALVTHAWSVWIEEAVA